MLILWGRWQSCRLFPRTHQENWGNRCRRTYCEYRKLIKNEIRSKKLKFNGRIQPSIWSTILCEILIPWDPGLLHFLIYTCTGVYVAEYIPCVTLCQSSRIAKYRSPLQAMLGPIVSVIFCNTMYLSTLRKGALSAVAWKVSQQFQTGSLVFNRLLTGSYHVLFILILKGPHRFCFLFQHITVLRWVVTFASWKNDQIHLGTAF